MSSQEPQKPLPVISDEPAYESMVGPKSLSSSSYGKMTQHSQLSGEQSTASTPYPTTTSSVQPSQQHDSINLYGSYIPDSYVGDFSGEVNPELVENADLQPEGNSWQEETKGLDGVLEFSFDSFGPESMLFPRTSEMINDDDLQEKSFGILSKENEDTANIMPKKSQTSKSTNSTFDIKSNSSSVSKDAHDVTPEDKSSSYPSNVDSVSNITSPNSTVASSNTSSSASVRGGNFRRNSSLTMSQRRRIRPKMKIEEIFNASDDSNTNVALSSENGNNGLNQGNIANEDSDSEDDDNEEEDAQNDLERNQSATISPSFSNDNFCIKDDRPESKSSSRDDTEGLSINQNTLSRKKISANRDLLNSDDIIHDEVPRVKGVTFSSTVEENSIPELTVREELNDTRNWRESCPIGDNGEVKKIDLKVIEPYKKVLSHGGYYHHYNSALTNRNHTDPAPGPAIIIFSACYLPDRSRKDYDYVMNNLFMYVLTTLHELVADDYILIYFHNAGGPGVSSNNMPTLSWFKRCYTMIDRRLRKNLKNLFLVHPTFWLKTFVIMTKPFISTKFARKLKFVSTLAELNEMVPIESAIIPPPVKQVELERMVRKMKKEAR